MYSPDTGLTPKQAERLAILVEEAGEVLQICGKIGRHGIESRDPMTKDSRTNRELLETEIGDVLAAIRKLEEAGVIDGARVAQHTATKLVKLEQWLHYH